MDDWDKRTWNYQPPSRQAPPPPSPLEVCWCVRGPSHRLLTCGIYPTDAPRCVELRAGYSYDHFIQTHLFISVEHARILAAQWLEALRAMGGWEELPHEPH